MNARPRPRLRGLLSVLTVAAVTLGAVACTAAPDHQPSSIRAPRAPHAAKAVSHTKVAACHPYASSLRPPPGPPQVTSSPFAMTIRRRGYLVAGVDQNTYNWGFRNPFNGQIVGFDIDMIKAVAKAIGVSKIVWKAIPDSEREPAVESNAVDIVAHTMTILCIRLQGVDFSSVYFVSPQRVLVLKTSKATGLADLRGQKVCTTTGADSIAAIVKYRAIPVTVPYWTDCLVQLQQGDVAAISTDDSILHGLAAQDPWTTVVGPPLNYQPYGLAISKEHRDFVRFVNAVLEQMRTDGQWAASYRHWIGPSAPNPPQPQYSD